MNKLGVIWKKFRTFGMFMDSFRLLVDFFGFYRELFGAAYPVVFEDQVIHRLGYVWKTPRITHHKPFFL